MDLPNSKTAKDLAGLGAIVASIDIGNSHVTHSQARRESHIPYKAEESLLLPLQIRDSSNAVGTYLMQLHHQISIHQFWRVLSNHP